MKASRAPASALLRKDTFSGVVGCAYRSGELVIQLEQPFVSKRATRARFEIALKIVGFLFVGE